MISLLLWAQATQLGSPSNNGESAAASVTAPEAGHEFSLTPERLFAAAEQLAMERRYKEAIHFLEPLTTNINPDYRAEARARIARIYVVQGDYREAASWFQKLLDEKPDAAAVRVELADVLLRMGDAGAASRQLRRAAAAKELPAAVTRALGRAGAALRSDAPVQFSFQIGIAPDTNINRATQAQAVDIYGLPFALNQTARAQSGVGLTLGGELTLQHKMGATSRMVASISANGNLYRASAFNDLSLTAGIGPEFFHGSISFRPSIIGGERWYGSHPLYKLYGLSAALKVSTSKSAQMNFSLTGLRLDYPVRPDLSGPLYSASIAYERALSQRASVRLNVSGSRIKTVDASQSSSTLGADMTLSRDVGRIIAYTKLGFSRTIGDAPFAGFGVARDDRLYEGEIGIIYKRISLWGLSPLIRFKRTENHSPLALYDYRQNRYEFALTKTF